MYYSLDKRIWFTIISLPLKGSHSVLYMDFLYYTFTYFVPMELSRIELLKLTTTILMENCDHSICLG